jgi:hypothetical protein
MDIFAGRGAGFDAGKDHFQLLNKDGFEVKELVLVVLGELFAPGNGDEVVELFPALDMVFKLLDETVDS